MIPASVRALALVLVLTLSACVPLSDNAAPDLPTKPMRVISLDYCADQFVLELLDEEHILALSPDAVNDYSYLKDTAVGMPTVRPIAEDVLTLKPDLVVRSYGGGPQIKSFLHTAGVPTLQVGWTDKVEGDEVGSIPWLIKDMAAGLGVPGRGEVLIESYRAKLAALPAKVPENPVHAMYMTPAGYTTGSGSLVHEMLSYAGLTNFQTAAGWHPVPLERLVYEKPDMIAAAFFDTFLKDFAIWSPSRHPVAEKQLNNPNTVLLQGSWTTCGGWFIADAIEALAAGREAASQVGVQ